MLRAVRVSGSPSMASVNGSRVNPPSRNVQPVKPAALKPGGWPQRLVSTVEKPIMITQVVMARMPQPSSRAVERSTRSPTPTMPRPPATMSMVRILVCSKGTERTTTISGVIELITEATPPGSR